MAEKPLLDDLAKARPIEHANEASRVLAQMDHVDAPAGIEDVVLRVDVADMVAVGVVDARLVRRDAPERDLTHDGLPGSDIDAPLPAGLRLLPARAGDAWRAQRAREAGPDSGPMAEKMGDRRSGRPSWEGGRVG